MGSSQRIKFFLAVMVALNLFLVAGCDNPAAMNASSANVKHISQGEFAGEVARAAGPVVVDFYATWCVPCRVLAPMLDQAAEPLAGKIRFFKVNIDESPRPARDFQIEGIPTVLLFKDGKLSDRIAGVPTARDLKSKLDALLTGK